MARTAAANIDEYIAAFPPDVQSVLQKFRRIVRKIAPQATEKISYSIPAFVLDGMLIFFAAFRKHIGIYPPVRGDQKLNKELSRYRGPKGNLQFPLDEPMPYKLIERVVRARLKENNAAKAKKKAK